MIFGLVSSFVFGTIIGSFLNVLTIRLPREEKANGRSRCPSCGHNLSWYDLVPIVSYISLGGKCAYCGQRISRRYLYGEIVVGLLFALVFARFYPESLTQYMHYVRALVAVISLFVIFVIDFEHFLILDKVLAWAGGSVLAINLLIDWQTKPSISTSLTLNGLIAALGLTAVFGLIYIVSKGRWIGFGDVKFALLIGLITPFPIIVVNIFLAFMLGAVVGIALIAAKVKGLKSEVPFGTFLSVSTFVCLLYGEEILNWYLKLIGLRF